MSLTQAEDTTEYKLNLRNCQVRGNTLGSKDSLIEFGEINYKQFVVTLSNVHLLDNVLELGTIYSLKMNCKQLLIRDSTVLRNEGQFASLEPASSDSSNPLVLYLTNTVFLSNYAKTDALIQLTTNSILKANNSLFTENYSIGRGSIVFADYQAVYAQFVNCSFTKNYAY